MRISRQAALRALAIASLAAPAASPAQIDKEFTRAAGDAPVLGAGKVFLAIWNLIAGAGPDIERVPIPRPRGDVTGKAQAFAYYRLIGEQPKDFFDPGPGADKYTQRRIYVQGPPEIADAAASAGVKTVTPDKAGAFFPTAKASATVDIWLPTKEHGYQIRKIFYTPEAKAGIGEAGSLGRARVTDNPVGFAAADTKLGLTFDLVPEMDADPNARFSLFARTTSPTYGSAMARWYTSVGTNIPGQENLFKLVIEATDGPAGPRIDTFFTGDDSLIRSQAPRLHFTQPDPELDPGRWVLDPADRFFTVDFTVPAYTGRTSLTEGVGLLADLETGYEMRASMLAPEPGTAGLVLLGGVGLVALVRRRRLREYSHARR